jgi:hypothetical protein
MIYILRRLRGSQPTVSIARYIGGWGGGTHEHTTRTTYSFPSLFSPWFLLPLLIHVTVSATSSADAIAARLSSPHPLCTPTAMLQHMSPGAATWELQGVAVLHADCYRRRLPCGQLASGALRSYKRVLPTRCCAARRPSGAAVVLHVGRRELPH